MERILADKNITVRIDSGIFREHCGNDHEEYKDQIEHIRPIPVSCLPFIRKLNALEEQNRKGSYYSVETEKNRLEYRRKDELGEIAQNVSYDLA